MWTNVAEISRYVDIVDLVESFLMDSNSDEYLVFAEIGVDTAETEPLKIWR